MPGELRAGRGTADATAQAACTGRDRLKAVGLRARAERTANMLFMFVVLDVSKLSAWLNADAPCRVERRARVARRATAQEMGWHRAGGGPDSRLEVRACAGGTLNMRSMVVMRDVSKLSG